MGKSLKLCTTSSQIRNNHAVITLNQWLLVYSHQSLIAVATQGGEHWYLLDKLTPAQKKVLNRTIQHYHHDHYHWVTKVELLSLLHHELCSLNQEEK